MYKRGQCWLVFVRPIRAPEKEIVPFVPTYASLKSTLAENLLPKKRDEIPITFWLGWLDAPTSPPYRLDAHERDHRLLVRGITMIKMTQEDYFKLEIWVSQSLAKQRLRGRSRKKGKKANRDWENIFKKADKTNEQTWQIWFCFVSECLSGAPNENIVQNLLNIALLNVFQYSNGRYRHQYLTPKNFSFVRIS